MHSSHQTLDDHLQSVETRAANIRAAIERLLKQASQTPSPSFLPHPSNSPKPQPSPLPFTPSLITPPSKLTALPKPTPPTLPKSTIPQPPPPPPTTSLPPLPLPPPLLPPPPPPPPPPSLLDTTPSTPPSDDPRSAPSTPEPSSSSFSSLARLERKLDVLHSTMVSALSTLQSRRSCTTDPTGDAFMPPPPPPPPEKRDPATSALVDVREAMLRELKERIKGRLNLADDGAVE